MLRSIRRALAKTPLRPIYRKLRLLAAGRSQSNESMILDRLIKAVDAPLTFIEFGFHATEFNCIRLVHRAQGLLIDGDAAGVAVAREVLPRNVETVARFLTLENLDLIRNRFAQIGILSIDVDGNDYWFLEALIDTRPSIVVAEYNASLGLRPITVPYDAEFDRHQKHASGWYHGASITALCKLAARHGYGLAAVSDGGQNLFFTRDGSLDPAVSWRPNVLREKWSGKSVPEQWSTIAEMPFVTV
jgi:hypothetical protein